MGQEDIFRQIGMLQYTNLTVVKREYAPLATISESVWFFGLKLGNGTLMELMNNDFPIIKIGDEMELIICGIVTYSIKKH